MDKRRSTPWQPRTLEDLLLGAASWPIPADWWSHFTGYDPEHPYLGLRFEVDDYEVWLLPDWIDSNMWAIEICSQKKCECVGVRVSTKMLPELLENVPRIHGELTCPV